MKSKLTLSLVLGTLISLNAQFTITNYPVNSANPYDILIGQGRNDGINRIYLTTKAGKVQEWTWNGTNGWVMLNLPTPSSLVTNKLIYITLGNARNDGVKRLYFAQFNAGTKVYESVFVNNAWQTTEIGTETSHVGSLIIDNLDGDNINKLYVSGISGVWEYKWNPATSSFSRTFLAKSDPYGSEGPCGIGDVRANGSRNMYLCGPNLFELTKNTGVIDFSPIIATANYTEMASVGDGRNDSKSRVYTANATGRFEYSYVNNNWQRTDLSATGQGRTAIKLAAIHSDGLNRIYMSQPAGNLTEYTWNASSQSYTSRQVVDATSGATSLIASGNARNDNTIRMYVPGYGVNKLYEITATSPLTSNSKIEDRTKLILNLSSTIIQESIEFRLFSKALVSITDVTGKTWYKCSLSPDTHKIPILNYTNGIYFLRIQSSEKSDVFKFIKK